MLLTRARLAVPQVSDNCIAIEFAGVIEALVSTAGNWARTR